MLRYLYIPKDFDLDEHIDYAVNNNFHQVIHGPSDIIKNLIENENNIQEINIPEYSFISNNSLIFQEKENFVICIIDEFNIKNKYMLDKAIIYRKDDINLKQKKFIFAKKINKINNYIYEVPMSLENYGTYIIEIICINNNNEKNILLSDEIIIYKEYKEESVTDDKFYFS